MKTLFELIKEGNIFCPIDNWIAKESESIFKHTKNAIILPVSEFYSVDKSIAFDSFIMLSKRCYNSFKVRNHICQYLNYFEKFYDKDHELLLYYYRMKYMIDFGITDKNGNSYPYTLESFFHDIKKYILSDSIYNKVWNLIQDNYTLDLQYSNKNNRGLQYTNKHAMYFLEISFFQNILIPILSHYIYKNKIIGNQIDDIIIEVYNWLFNQYLDEKVMSRRNLQPADMFNKLYETVNTIMNSDYKRNNLLWKICEIRGMNPVINSLNTINMLIIQCMPKYVFNDNLIKYNISSVKNDIEHNVSDIGYEYDFKSLSSSKRDGEDNSSQFDKFEAHLMKIDEGLVLQNDYRAKKTMAMIRAKYAPIEQDEIDFYRHELIKNDAGRTIINKFQQKLINYCFYSCFGDTVSTNSINSEDYIVLMIAAKRKLQNSGMIILPYIISGNVIKICSRTSLCKKEMMKLEESEYYQSILLKYNNDDKMIKQILSLISTILSSDFSIIDYNDKELNGKKLVILSDYLIDEVLCFINQI